MNPEEYNEMDGESVLMVNYCGKVLAFYPDYGLTSSSSAFINIMTNYENPNVESIQITNSSEVPNTPVKNSSAYYDYAVAHYSEFWRINQDWRDDKEYYYLVDVDHDGQKKWLLNLVAVLVFIKKLTELWKKYITIDLLAVLEVFIIGLRNMKVMIT